MQFVKHGPSIPSRLLRAHEEGRVVFFCGAGISFPAGLKDFKWLVKRILVELHADDDQELKSLVKRKRFDGVLSLLEERHSVGRPGVRQALAKILAVDKVREKHLRTHEALLRLSSHGNSTRLVTTNFDRLFERAIQRTGTKMPTFQAPYLPVPKKHWDGLVYLHGLIPEGLNEDPESSRIQLDHLVVSSGDFGLAYLTERWASRFVGELFRRYSICFVGYSLEDPVLRYMTDALSADRLKGEGALEMFAFAGFADDKKQACESEWRAKNVTPILYPDTAAHRILHDTLHAWASMYCEGTAGKIRLVEEYARLDPTASTPEDDFAGRMLWALLDASGEPAKRFAALEPVPSLEWLGPLAMRSLGFDDLTSVGVLPGPQHEHANPYFSLFERPAPYPLAPHTKLVGTAPRYPDLDKVLRNLTDWLVRHLDDPRLLLWCANAGGHLHSLFAHKILDQVRVPGQASLSARREVRERTPSTQPRANLSQAMRTLWGLMLAGHIAGPNRQSRSWNWLEQFNQFGPTPALRIQLRCMLAPKLKLSRTWTPPTGEVSPSDTRNIRRYVWWKVCLSTPDADHVVKKLQDPEVSPQLLMDFLPDLCLLLKDALDLMRHMEGDENDYEGTRFDQPSIAPHSQNANKQDWTTLIDLARDSWLALARERPKEAVQFAEHWAFSTLSLFKRLAFFAARSPVVSTTLAINWLLLNRRWWLWHPETRREAMEFLRARAKHFKKEELRRLESGILAGPPRKMYRRGLSAQEWLDKKDGAIWHRLATLRTCGPKLSPESNIRLLEIESRHPDWTGQPDELEEFAIRWGDSSAQRVVNRLPRELSELIAHMERKDAREHGYWETDDWWSLCKNDQVIAAQALCALAQREIWKSEFWNEALQAWSEEELAEVSWQALYPTLRTVPDSALFAIRHGLSEWLGEVYPFVDSESGVFLDLCNRLLHLPGDYEDDAESEDQDPEVRSRAINHPSGKATRALLYWWLRDAKHEVIGLQGDLQSMLTYVSATEGPRLRYARFVLSQYATTLFLVDEHWTRQNLLPRFDWRRSEVEANAVWQGYLRSAHPHRVFLECIKPSLLDAAGKFHDLQDVAQEYAILLTHTALRMPDFFSNAELRGALKRLPETGMRSVVHSLVESLRGAEDGRKDWWQRIIEPFLNKYWPSYNMPLSPDVVREFALLCIESKEAFPEVLNYLDPYTTGEIAADYLISRMDELQTCKDFPQDSLAFLCKIVGNQNETESRIYDRRSLRSCLNAIEGARPDVNNDNCFRRLSEIAGPGE